MARQHWNVENTHSKRVNVEGKENIDICEEEEEGEAEEELFRVCEEDFLEEKPEKLKKLLEDS